jgi:hypothetical protein
MLKPLRFLAAAALLSPALAPAQTVTTTTTPLVVSPSLEVTRLAPQLIVFAGGQSNFDSLVNGLALGAPVTLVSVLPTGQIQTVTFTPQGTMTPLLIAQTLENARQSLISRGFGTPSAQQIAISLTGGALPTQTGNVQVAGLLPAANQPTTIQPASAAAGATGAAVNPVTTTTSPGVGTLSPSALIQGQSGGTTPPSPAQIIQNQRGSNISDTPTLGNISNTPSAATNSTLTGNTNTIGSTTGTTAAPAGAVGASPGGAVGAAPAAAPAR